jgi:hypothetical protein
MAVFGPYTTPVKPAEWVDPLNLDLYLKGTMYKQELAERTYKIYQTHIIVYFQEMHMVQIKENFLN